MTHRFEIDLSNYGNYTGTFTIKEPLKKHEDLIKKVVNAINFYVARSCQEKFIDAEVTKEGEYYKLLTEESFGDIENANQFSVGELQNILEKSREYFMLVFNAESMFHSNDISGISEIKEEKAIIKNATKLISEIVDLHLNDKELGIYSKFVDDFKSGNINGKKATKFMQDVAHGFFLLVFLDYCEEVRCFVLRQTLALIKEYRKSTQTKELASVNAINK